LIRHSSHPSISTQTENIDLSARLEAVEQEMKRKWQVARYRSTEDVLRRGIEELEREFEGPFQKKLNQQLDLFHVGNLAAYQADERRRTGAELECLRHKVEVNFRQQAAELCPVSKGSGHPQAQAAQDGEVGRPPSQDCRERGVDV
jgi:hypothetical protein